jgi:hypothetical protein
MSWATPDQALLWTGQAVTEEELAPASAIVTVYAGREEEEPADAISTRDRRWLGMATAFQAVWMRAKPGVLEHRESHTSSSADGVSVSRESDSQVMLAPMASRCLRNLSWVGNRTTAQGPAGHVKGSILSERADAFHTWKPVSIQ